MSLLRRFFGLGEPPKEPELSPSEELLLRSIQTKLAVNDGITLINNSQIVHNGTNLERIRISGATLFKNPQNRSHTIVFGGSSIQEAIDFTKELAITIEYGSPRRKDAQEVLHKVLNELVKTHYPGKIFQMSNDRQHELCDDKALDFKPRSYHEKAVNHAYRAGMTLEF